MLKSLCFLVLAPLLFGLSHAFAHGVGGETLPPVLVDNKKVTIQISVEPSIFDKTQNQNKIIINLFDITTGEQINNVTYRIDLFHNKNQVFSEKFFTESGSLLINTVNDSGPITVFGSKEPILGGWMADGNNTLEIKGPIFLSGGLYNFKITILSFGTLHKLENPIVFQGAISIAENTNHHVLGNDGNLYDLTVISYYDQISQFVYDDKTISFFMSFDWSNENIGKTNIVHEEIHVPKNFGDFLFPGYDVYVNGNILPKDATVVDDYSETDRIIHIILHQTELPSLHSDVSNGITFLITPAKETGLHLSSQTSNLEFKVNFWWNPEVIHSEQDMTFYVEISEQYVAVKQTRPVEYDFVILQSQKEIFRIHRNGILNSDNPDQIHHVFSPNQTGPISISVEKIDGKKLANANFVAVVNNDLNTEPKFPIRISSQKLENGKMVEGKYFVDITWIPSPLNLYDESEFIFTIYDKSTLMPKPNTRYDFVLEKDDIDLFRKSGFASAGGSFEDFRFLNDHLGMVTLRIENIGDTNEFIELPMNVTPEFSDMRLIILGLSVSFPVFLLKLLIQKRSILPSLNSVHTPK